MGFILYYLEGVAWGSVVLYAVQCIILLVVLWAVVYKPYLRAVRKRQKEITESVIKIERAEAILRDAKAKRVEILAGKRGK